MVSTENPQVIHSTIEGKYYPGVPVSGPKVPEEKGHKGQNDKEDINFVPNIADVTVPFSFESM